MDLKQQQRRQLRISRSASNVMILIPCRSFREMLACFSAVDFSKTVSKFRKRKESRRLVFTSSPKGVIRHFHVVVVHWEQRNIQKSVMHVRSCCFANLNVLLFCCSR